MDALTLIYSQQVRPIHDNSSWAKVVVARYGPMRGHVYNVGFAEALPWTRSTEVALRASNYAFYDRNGVFVPKATALPINL